MVTGIIIVIIIMTMLKYKMFIMGNCIACTVNCNHRMAATLYTLETLFDLGILLLLLCIKVITYDDDDDDNCSEFP